MEAVLLGMFRNSNSNCAGGKVGNAKVVTTTNRNVKANKNLVDIVGSIICVGFLCFYEM